MTSLKFGWKRKAGSNVDKSALAFQDKQQEEPTDDDEDDIAIGDCHWSATAPPDPKRPMISLEDTVSKAKRLKHEGCVLAEAERFWEALKRWDEALQLTPKDEKILEMKAQALMSLNEVLPAVQTAQLVVELAPMWWVAHQTLGRAHLNLGEVHLALSSFSRAIRLNPSEQELWQDDLMWCKSLLDRKKVTLTAVTSHRRPTSPQVSRSHDVDDDSDDDSEDNDNDGMEASDIRPRRVPENYVHMRDPV